MMNDMHTKGDLLSPEELKRILRYTEELAIGSNKKNLMKAGLIRIYALTGRRRGEILDLRVGDVDFENNLIHTHIEKRKQKQHKKIVSIDSKTTQILKQLAGNRGDRAKLFGIAPVTAVRWVKEIAKACNINKDVTVHSFRYSLITFLKTKGYTNEQIGLITGQHPMTVGRYDQSSFFNVKDDFEQKRNILLNQLENTKEE